MFSIGTVEAIQDIFLVHYSEILAAATSADRMGLMFARLRALHCADSPLPLVLTVDSL